ncbi:MAG: ABC transporter ATP-binding protein [Gammaproteobacteria bacterium]
MSLLTLSGIHHAFGDLAVLHDVSLEVQPGQVTSLLGPSGCGKSTLLRIAAGLETLQAGVVRIGDKTVADSRHSAPPETRGVGMVFQDYALFPHLSVMDNILFGVKGGRAERREWATRSLEKIGLSDAARRYPHVLSGGQQQRVALLRALAARPRVLLMDEPFSGLDVTLRARVRDETLDILREEGVAALMVTHDPEEAMILSDRILVMNGGRIVQSGTPGEIYWHPADAFVAGLFGTLNRLTAVVENGRVSTPLGVLEAPGIPDGRTVEVMFRPAALRLSPVAEGGAGNGADAKRARVSDFHLLGQATDVRLELDLGDDQAPLSLRAWVPGVCRAERGAEADIVIDPSKVFVFPCAQ